MLEKSLMFFKIVILVLLVGLVMQLGFDGEASLVSAGQDVERQTVPTRTFTPTPVTPTATSPTATATSPPPTNTPPPPVTSTPLPPATNTPVPPTVTATPTPVTILVIITARIDTEVYSGPGTDFPIVGVLETGDTATVLGRNDDGSWWQINFLASTAWIADTAVTISAATGSVPVVTAPLSETKSSTPATLPDAGGGSWWLVGGMLLLLNGALLLLTGVRVRRRGH